jgi:hypothetical protein
MLVFPEGLFISLRAFFQPRAEDVPSQLIREAYVRVTAGSALASQLIIYLFLLIKETAQ